MVIIATSVRDPRRLMGLMTLADPLHYYLGVIFALVHHYQAERTAFNVLHWS